MSYLRAELDELLVLAKQRHSLEETYSRLALHELDAPPPIRWDAATLAACDEAYARWVVPGENALVPRGEIGVAPWIFLEYLVRHRGYLVHGSANDSIAVFEPRAANDNVAEGDTPKIHAASSGVTAIFFAIIDRRRLLEVPCVPAISAIQASRQVNGVMEDAFWFVVDWRALPYRPWRDGTVYVLPRDTFRDEYRGMQWSSRAAVRPLARISVTPTISRCWTASTGWTSPKTTAAPTPACSAPPGAAIPPSTPTRAIVQNHCRLQILPRAVAETWGYLGPPRNVIPRPPPHHTRVRTNVRRRPKALWRRVERQAAFRSGPPIDPSVAPHSCV